MTGGVGVQTVRRALLGGRVRETRLEPVERDRERPLGDERIHDVPEFRLLLRRAARETHVGHHHLVDGHDARVLVGLRARAEPHDAEHRCLARERHRDRGARRERDAVERLRLRLVDHDLRGIGVEFARPADVVGLCGGERGGGSEAERLRRGPRGISGAPPGSTCGSSPGSCEGRPRGRARLLSYWAWYPTQRARCLGRVGLRYHFPLALVRSTLGAPPPGPRMTIEMRRTPLRAGHGIRLSSRRRCTHAPRRTRNTGPMRTARSRDCSAASPSAATPTSAPCTTIPARSRSPTVCNS